MQPLKFDDAMMVADGSILECPACDPSDRRDGLTITFSCETCEDLPVLSIVQHKGLTLVGWL
jgi:hypothetical protein